MEYKHIKDIDLASNINNRVFAIFLARDVDIRVQKDGKTKYINLNLCDRDFKIDAKKFGASDTEIESMKNGGVYRGAIDIKEYAKSPNGYSCIIYNFEPHNEPAANFIEWANGMSEAQEVIQKTLNELNESIYGAISAKIIIEKWSKFSSWSAASSFHHDCMGGLLVHTAEVIEQASEIGDLWEEKYGPGFINRPLLLAGALLHDIGKLEELNVSVDSGTTEYSNKASLETHITMGVSMIDIEAYKLGLGYQTSHTNDDICDEEEDKTEERIQYEREAISLLKHCILSHHGKKEYGSPIEMNCPEASIINIADGLSAEMYRYNKTFGKMESGTSNTTWLGGNMVVTYKDSSK